MGKMIVVPAEVEKGDGVEGITFEKFVENVLYDYEPAKGGKLMRTAWKILDKVEAIKEGSNLNLEDTECELLKLALEKFVPHLKASHHARAFYEAIDKAKDPKEPDEE